MARCRMLASTFVVVIGLLTMLFCTLADAAEQGGVVLNRTRIIFSDGKQTASFGLRNAASHPWLVQVRVLTAEEKETPLFIALPPLFRLDTGLSNQVRIVATGDKNSYPTDKEGVWFVHVLTVPPSKAREGDDITGMFHIGLESVIKLFWRPSSLQEPDDNVYRQVTFVSQGEAIRACNATPYYLSFDRLSFDDAKVDLNRQPSMLPPFGCQLIAGKGHRAHWAMINDYGGSSQLFSADVAK